jgi:hypothetical protein
MRLQGFAKPFLSLGMRSEAHMREDLSIFDFELTAEERGTVDELLAN